MRSTTLVSCIEPTGSAELGEKLRRNRNSEARGRLTDSLDCSRGTVVFGIHRKLFLARVVIVSAGVAGGKSVGSGRSEHREPEKRAVKCRKTRGVLPSESPTEMLRK